MNFWPRTLKTRGLPEDLIWEWLKQPSKQAIGTQNVRNSKTGNL